MNIDILQDYIRHPLLPKKIDNPTLHRVENNALCDDSIEVFMRIEDGILVDFGYHGNLSMTALGSVSFLYDWLLGRSIDEIKTISYIDFQNEGILVSMKRKKTAALPLVAIINAIHMYQSNPERLDVEQYAYKSI